MFIPPPPASKLCMFIPPPIETNRRAEPAHASSLTKLASGLDYSTRLLWLEWGYCVTRARVPPKLRPRAARVPPPAPDLLQGALRRFSNDDIV